MGWYSVDAIDIAFKKTKKILNEPFNFWKWLKLAIIIFFIGGGIGNQVFNYNPGGFDKPFSRNGVEGSSVDKISNQMGLFWHQYQTYILIAVTIFILFILIFGFISSVMEFVFMESIVTNIVSIRAYFKKYLRQGFSLFLVRMIIGLFTLMLLIAAASLVFLPFLRSGAVITPGLIWNSIFWLILILLVLALVNGIIGSFISLSIPIMMYRNIGIIAALGKIIARLREEWKQILVYWIMRIIIGLVAGILVGIVAIIVLIVFLIAIILLGAILYFLLSGLGLGVSNLLFWVVMITYGVIAAIPLIIFLLLASVPVPVFMKFHLLTFLRMWFKDLNIPFFDETTIDNVNE
jgi:hypothetical protein